MDIQVKTVIASAKSLTSTNNAKDLNRYPLSGLQEGLLFHALYAPEVALYVNQVIIKLNEEVNTVQLKLALQNLIARHAILRASFDHEQSQQIIHPTVNISLQLLDYTHLSRKKQLLAKFLKADKAQTFKLTQPPLHRFALIKLAETDYRFILSYHHILIGGPAALLLIKEIFSDYDGLLTACAATTNNTYQKYLDYIKNWDAKPAENYWRALIGDFATPVILPKLNVSNKIYGPQQKTWQLPRHLVTRLQQFSHSHGLTLNIVCQAAWGLLLARYTGLDDIIFGQVRELPRPLIKALAGLFINTLPIRIKINQQLTVQDLLQQLLAQHKMLPTVIHTPLSNIQQYASLPAGANLITTVFDFKPLSPIAALKKMDPKWATRDLTFNVATHYPLLLEIYGEENALFGRINFLTEYFDTVSIKRLIGHYHTLLNGIVTGIEQLVVKLPLLTSREWQRQLINWNNTAADYPRDKTIAQLFEAQTKKNPGNIAVTFAGKDLTYQELNAKANQLAHYLRKQGVKSETLVAICIERSFEMLIGILGILKAGGAYIPIDPHYPTARIQYMLEDSQASLLLTEQKLLALLQPLLSHITAISLDGSQKIFSKEKMANLPNVNTAHNLAYVIYTSGSTGNPKGVMIENHSVINLLISIAKKINFTSQERLLAITPYGFDIANLEFFLPLLTGAQCIISANNTNRDTKKIIADLEKYEITTLQATPLTWKLLLDAGWKCKSGIKLLCGGEALSNSLAKELLKASPFLWNLYGPTETSIWSSIYKLSENPTKTAYASLGQGLANTQIYILDRHQQVVPIGIPGEICIAGAGLARGYAHQPDLTHQQFIDVCLKKKAQTIQIYRTGDRGRWIEDGNIEYLGRLDDQVKVRGFRIELGEIEANLLNLSQVKQASVLIKNNQDYSQQIIAYVTVHKNKPITTQAIHQVLKQKLPAYMQPNKIEIIKKFPLTPNGKVDKSTLLKFNSTAKANKRLPLSQMEKTLRKVWADVLNLSTSQINSYDNFFELGGHSLLATKLAVHVQKTMGIPLKLQTIFDFPTIHQLSNAIKNTTSATLPSLLPTDRFLSLPLSSAQLRLWFLDKLAPQTSTYNMFLALRLQGSLNIAALEMALQTLIQRHEILRTYYSAEQGEPYQVISPSNEVKFRLNLEDFYKASEQELMAQAHQEAQTPFLLDAGPLIRVRLLKTAQAYLLFICLHHSIADGWSMGILNHELSNLYNADITGNTIALPDLTLQYADYAAWQQKCLADGVFASQLEYWKKQLQDVPVLDLPTDFPRPTIQTFKGECFKFTLSKSITQKLKKLAKQEKVTLFTSIFSIFSILLARYANQDDFTIGVPIAGRNKPEFENMVGMFVNTLALRCNLSENPSFHELLRYNQKVALEAFSNQDAPFEKVVEMIQPLRDQSRNPLSQVMFSFFNENDQMPNLKNLLITPLNDNEHAILQMTDYESSKFDLSLYLQESNDYLQAYFEYNTQLFSHAYIERFSTHFRNLTENFIEDATLQIYHAPFMTAEEQKTILIDWNNTSTSYPQEKTIINLFEDQVKKTPTNIATIFEDQALTYKNLNEKANKLAHYLKKQGIKPGDMVVIYMGRSLEMLIGILAIFKIGATYVPIEPSYPKMRVQYLLDDCGATTLLTQEHLFEQIKNCLPTNLDKYHIIALDKNWPLIAKESVHNFAHEKYCDLIAYLIYTSGSTGKPKGVCGSHKGLTNRITWMQAEYQLNHNDKILHKTSISFDVSLWELFWPLITGAQLVIAKPNIQQDPKALIKAISHYGISIIHFVPSMLSAFLTAKTVKLCKTLRKIYASGETLSVALQNQFFEILPKVGLYNLYGPTEAAIDATHWQCNPKATFNAIPIGKPIANTGIYILDKYQQPMPIGVKGEIYIAGDGLALGYHNLPKSTQEKFLVNTSLHSQPMGIYKTGDFGSWLANGNIAYHGRIDRQVKIRGHRIELAEIEAALLNHPLVQNAVIIDQKASSDNIILVAFVTLKNKKSRLASHILSEFLAQRLPNYMLPKKIIKINEIPLLNNGKVNKEMVLKYLKKPAYKANSFIFPSNAIQHTLLEIWADILQITKSQISMNAGFFDLGGHSLLAIKVIDQIQTRLGVELELKSIFEVNTIEKLANLIGTKLEKHIEIDGMCYMARYQSPIVTLCAQGNKPPLFLFHPVGGTVFCYMPLAKYLGKDRPCYAIQDPAIENKDLLFSNIQDLASYYIDFIREIQPHGPYLLGGGSFGGTVAVEMAYQLSMMGETTDLIALMDLWALFTDEFKDRKRLDDAMLRQYLMIAERLKSQNIPEPTQWLDLNWQRMLLWLNYKPPIIHNKLTLFKAKELLPEYLPIQNDTNHWSKYSTQPIDVHIINGNHETIFKEPNVKLLAKKLITCIDSNMIASKKPISLNTNSDQKIASTIHASEKSSEKPFLLNHL